MRTSLTTTPPASGTRRRPGAAARLAGLTVGLAAASTLALAPGAAADSAAPEKPAGPAAAAPRCEHYDWGLEDFTEVRCSTLPPGTTR